jgi:TRAP-type C4-dicarboxylate transport system permease large subunit
VGLLIGTAAFVAAVFVGAVFLAGVVGFVLIGSVLLMLRAWWLRRELYKSVKGSGDLDGEYTVIHQEEIKTTTEHKRRN